MSFEIIRILLLVAVFAAVMLATEAILSSVRAARRQSGAMNKRMALLSRGHSREDVLVRLRRTETGPKANLPWPVGALAQRVARDLGGAGLTMDPTRLTLMLVLGAIGLFFILLWLLYMNGIAIVAGRVLLIATIALSVAVILPLMVVGQIATKRRKKLVEQFPLSLDVFVRGLRAGHPVSSALDLVSSEMSDPIGTEYGIVLDEITYGADMRDALQNMADRCGIEDMQMFVVALSIQTETGGNLAEILGNLTAVIRDRASMMMKVRALSSEGRMTALMLSLLPVVALVLIFISGPGFYLDVADDPLFLPGFGLLILSFAIGVMWIRKLVDLKV